MNPEEQVSLQVTFPFSPNWEKDWYVFFTDERKVNAEILDIASLCNGHIEDLDYSKMLSGRISFAEQVA